MSLQRLSSYRSRLNSAYRGGFRVPVGVFHPANEPGCREVVDRMALFFTAASSYPDHLTPGQGFNLRHFRGYLTLLLLRQLCPEIGECR